MQIHVCKTRATDHFFEFPKNYQKISLNRDICQMRYKKKRCYLDMSFRSHLLLWKYLRCVVNMIAFVALTSNNTEAKLPSARFVNSNERKYYVI